ncbi:hypothetical protein EVG20_g1636 [Dentipellis fragilis]|uniref:LigT-like protein n=1 Tax=Dentipellis fragilis TaxID=205917 RepID=A0A4Y9Z9Z8_9AGAM|nr:hypothetical protein EVG20_g1636 [Dentipellis fragilis]
MAQHRPKPDSTYPTFHPHITLASLPASIDLLVLREAIPISHSVLPVRFAAVAAGNHYFRSVYVAIQPSTDLATLHGLVHEALDVEPRTPLFPHMSLYYIDDKDEQAFDERKRALADLVSRGVVLDDEQGGVALDCVAGDPNVDPQVAGTKLNGFIGSEIWIVKCEGAVEEWEVLDKIILATTKH